MPIAELFLGPIITELVKKLASGERSKLFRFQGLGEKIKKWNVDLELIKTKLAHAEERQLTDGTVQLWLEELQDVAYDMDDILDELNTESSRRKETESRSTSKVWKLIPSGSTSFTPSAFMFNRRVVRKIDEITIRLDDLMKRNHGLDLTTSDGGNLDNVGQGFRATASIVEKSYVLGREEEKAAICKLLLQERKRNHNDEVRSVCVIPILGMGGLGKTTLAQLVFNDDQVKARFDHRAWVCISNDFDLMKISNLIYDSVAEAKGKFKDLNGVQASLKEKLSNKKFLVVLDDVWEENYAKWDQLRGLFLNGAPESAIVITTRIPGVAQLMGSTKSYNLKLLPEKVCISILAQHALEKPNFDEDPELKEVGESIASKCGGLPLAAKSLGGILHAEKNLNQWQKVLTSNIWDLDTQSNTILPALRLSYHYLPPHLKPLFVYCSIFPKHFEFKKDDLILLWMAEGLLNQTGKNKSMEKLGLEYFNELLSRFFFQCSTGEKSRFLMHDLINDLALFVSGKVCYRLDEQMKSNGQPSISEKIRHSSFIRQWYGTYRKFMPYSEAVHLRTFLPTEVGNSGTCFMTKKVLNDLLPKLRCLRVLSLSGYHLSKLPRSVGDLKHLRYLDMSDTIITNLPNSVCQLYNLQTLLLRGCYRLNQLPTNIRDLTNLRHLDLGNTPELKWMPTGIGMLSSLCTLSKIIIGKRKRFQLTELKGLSNLKGKLSMFGMHNIGSAREAREANLLCKGGLNDLEMIWDENFEDCRDEGTEEQVLGALKPQAELERLVIECYGGTTFPSWVGDCSFSSMVYLKLSGCKKCTALPTLGRLASLKELYIEGMDGIKVVGGEFYGDGGVFPSLETLSFREMIHWEEWLSNCMSGEENSKAVFPQLGKLCIVGCGKLVMVCLPRFQSLGNLVIEECGQALVRSMVDLASVKTLKIEAIADLSQLDEGIINNFGELEVLHVSDCGDLRYLWKEKVACVILTKLRELKISGCRELVSLGEKEQVLPHNLEQIKLGYCESLEKMPSCCESLRNLEIYVCKKVKYVTPTKQNIATKTGNMKAIMATESSYSNKTDEMEEEEGFPNLQSLDIYNCASMEWLPTGKKKLPSTLKRLDIAYCENLKEPEENWLLNSISINLEDIRIVEWGKLKQLRKGWFFGFVHLTQLKIVSCEGIESIPERCLPTSLRLLRIKECKNLESMLLYKDEVKCLEDLQIINCKKLDFYSAFGGGGAWPPKLKSLTMGEVKQRITDWAQNLHSLPTSLTFLKLEGEFPEMVSLSDVGIHLPTSLKYLVFNGAVNLKSLQGKSLKTLTSLVELYLYDCPKLRSLPNMLLPTFSYLEYYNCPRLNGREFGFDDVITKII